MSAAAFPGIGHSFPQAVSGVPSFVPVTSDASQRCAPQGAGPAGAAPLSARSYGRQITRDGRGLIVGQQPDIVGSNSRGYPSSRPGVGTGLAQPQHQQQQQQQQHPVERTQSSACRSVTPVRTMSHCGAVTPRTFHPQRSAVTPQTIRRPCAVTAPTKDATPRGDRTPMWAPVSIQGQTHHKLGNPEHHDASKGASASQVKAVATPSRARTQPVSTHGSLTPPPSNIGSHCPAVRHADCSPAPAQTPRSHCTAHELVSPYAAPKTPRKYNVAPPANQLATPRCTAALTPRGHGTGTPSYGGATTPICGGTTPICGGTNTPLRGGANTPLRGGTPVAMCGSIRTPRAVGVVLSDPSSAAMPGVASVSTTTGGSGSTSAPRSGASLPAGRSTATVTPPCNVVETPICGGTNTLQGRPASVVSVNCNVATTPPLVAPPLKGPPTPAIDRAWYQARTPPCTGGVSVNNISDSLNDSYQEVVPVQDPVCKENVIRPAIDHPVDTEPPVCDVVPQVSCSTISSPLTSMRDESLLEEHERLYDEEWWYHHLEERRLGGAPPDCMVIVGKTDCSNVIREPECEPPLCRRLLH